MKIQIEQLDLLAPWPQMVLREGYGEMRVFVRVGSIVLGHIALRPIRKRIVSHRRLAMRIARELGDALLRELAHEALTLGPEALKWFMPAAWAKFDMSSASPRQRHEYLQKHFLLPSGLPSPLREWVIEAQRREASWPLPAVTVALCTRDRETILEEAIRTLQQIDYPNFEILLVNNSSDAVPTSELAQQLGVVCARCLVPGVSNARNVAIAHATSDWIAFLDDDCRPERNWLKELVRPTQDERCRAVFGRTNTARLETTAEVMLDMYERRTVQGDGGANMLIHRDFARAIGSFDPDLGAGMHSLGGGEDVELVQRIRAAGFSVEQATRAVVHHHRHVTPSALRKHILGRAMGQAAAHVRHGRLLRWAKQVLAVAGEIRAAMRGGTRYPYPLLLAEMRGTLAGPAKYLVAKLSNIHRHAPKPQSHLTTPAAAASDRTPIKPRLAA